MSDKVTKTEIEEKQKWLEGKCMRIMAKLAEFGAFDGEDDDEEKPSSGNTRGGKGGNQRGGRGGRGRGRGRK